MKWGFTISQRGADEKIILDTISKILKGKSPEKSTNHNSK